VYLWDRAAGSIISVGGAMVLAAVLGICVFLVWQVVPLFKGGHARQSLSRSLSSPPAGLVHVVLSDSSDAAMLLDSSGAMRAVSLRSGQEFWRSSLGEGKRIAAASRPEREGLISLAMSDGSVLAGRLAVSSRLMRDDEVTAGMRSLGVGEQVAVGEGGSGSLVVRDRPDRFRQVTPEVGLRELIKPGGAPAWSIDLRENSSGGRFLVTLSGDREGLFGTIQTTTPLGGGEPVDTVSSTPFALTAGRARPGWVFVTSDGRHILALWRDGTLERYATGVASDTGVKVTLAESTGTAPRGEVTIAAMLLGGQTLLVGDADGMVRAFDAARDPTSPAPDGMRLALSGEFHAGQTPVAGFAMGERDRLVAVAARDGSVLIRHMTSRKVIAHVTGAGERLALSPNSDALLAVDGEGRYKTWSLELGHADASMASLFAPIMYEGELRPRFIYQSSSGSDAAEVKMSLTPLIFGTLKATIVGMLVAVPLAVLGAIYSSEFMHKRLRRVVKPAVEMMASLPSVVLGFIAAMVVAPFMRDWLARTLVGILLTPVLLVFFAYLWQMVPRDAAAKVTRRARVLLIGAALVASAAIATALGPGVEGLLFRPTRTDELVAAGSYTPVPPEQWPAWVGRRATLSPDEERHLREEGLYFRSGNVVRPLEAQVPSGAAGPASIKRWLDGSIGDAMPGWLAALFFPVMLAVSFVQARVLSRERFEQMLGSTRTAMAAAELLRFGLIVACGAAGTWGLAWVFTRLGWDTRDSIFGPFSQRNSLVVGVIMGFAVIPLVYTISEDALRSVPNSLRSASLGVGATPWQTAVRVVLPAAGSGVFSAIMIGLGRAVGETMIVLMAAGNTPEISSNLFSGFRTLAANIAVELPEAESGSTHARILFLCGLVLFAMTFAINTTAEVVRQRFRRRNAAL
jgi:phosphate transport system permease protein